MCNSLQGMVSCVFLDRPTVFHRVASSAAFRLLLRAAALGCFAGVLEVRVGFTISARHAVYSLFSCVLYFPRHACSFLFGIVVARAAGHASTAVNLPFPSLLRHHSVGFCVCFWCSVGSCFVQLCSFSRGSFRVLLRGSSLLLCASSLYSSLADFCSGERLFLSLRRRNHLGT